MHTHRVFSHQQFIKRSTHHAACPESTLGLADLLPEGGADAKPEGFLLQEAQAREGSLL